MGKDSPPPPPAPDYKGAAQAQTASQHVSQYTPYGNQVYSQSGADSQGNPMYRSDISLHPQAQQTLDQQMQLSNQMGGLAQGQMGNVQQQYSKPMDLSSVQQIQDKAYGAMTSRLDPQWQQNEAMQKTQLANQGLSPGGEAYDNAMRTFNQGKNDAYQQANLGAIQTMPQTYQLAHSAYEQPLNQLNALRTGAQISNPQFSPLGSGTNYLGAAQAGGQYNQGLYNAQVGQQNAMTSGLFGLGSAAIMGGMMSDRRLKSNIKRVGTHPSFGIGIYEYDIFGNHEYGVMADEVEKVMPEAVTTNPENGYKMVYYGML